ncbi:alpha/beta fold hydrolase [Geminicoccus flavidas]|uniref:alpha/beta fold hydrolase n=1 Tax=Geminicoccus flavidas TaxID=2506407 RepID=UPI0013567809|nr:alpha/beta fold hydrolase [Geminicoccus flavidas]
MELASNVLPGEGRPLVVLHGLLGSGRNWLGPARRLNESGRPVVLADLRSHGQSPWARPMSYDAMADDVARLIAGLDSEAVDLLGHSMGGKVAMNLALRRPDRVARLVLVDIAPIAYRHRSFTDYLLAMRALDLAQVQRRGDADRLMEPAVPDVAMRSFLLQNLESDGGGGFHWRVDVDLLLAALPDLVGWTDPPGTPPFTGPALALRGALSPYVDEVGEAALRRLFPAVEIESLPEAGHWPHVEAAEPFLSALQAFLVRPDGRPAT